MDADGVAAEAPRYCERSAVPSTPNITISLPTPCVEFRRAGVRL